MLSHQSFAVRWLKIVAGCKQSLHNPLPPLAYIFLAALHPQMVSRVRACKSAYPWSWACALGWLVRFYIKPVTAVMVRNGICAGTMFMPAQPKAVWLKPLPSAASFCLNSLYTITQRRPGAAILAAQGWSRQRRSSQACYRPDSIPRVTPVSVLQPALAVSWCWYLGNTQMRTPRLGVGVRFTHTGRKPTALMDRGFFFPAPVLVKKFTKISASASGCTLLSGSTAPAPGSAAGTRDAFLHSPYRGLGSAVARLLALDSAQFLCPAPQALASNVAQLQGGALQTPQTTLADIQRSYRSLALNSYTLVERRRPPLRQLYQRRFSAQAQRQLYSVEAWRRSWAAGALGAVAGTARTFNMLLAPKPALQRPSSALRFAAYLGRLRHGAQTTPPRPAALYRRPARSSQFYTAALPQGIGRLETSLSELMGRFRQPQVRYRPGLATQWRSYRVAFNRHHCGGFFWRQKQLTSYVARLRRVCAFSYLYLLQLSLMRVVSQSWLCLTASAGIAVGVIKAGFLAVNGRRITNPLCQAYRGDFICLLVESPCAGLTATAPRLGQPSLAVVTAGADSPAYLEVDELSLGVFLLAEPSVGEIFCCAGGTALPFLTIKCYNWKYVT